MRMLIKISLFFVLMLINTAAMGADSAEERLPQKKFVDSNFDIPSKNFRILFYDNKDWAMNVPPHPTPKRLAGKYTSAVIIGNQSTIGDIPLTKFKAGPLHYRCLDDQTLYEDLEKKLEEENEDLAGKGEYPEALFLHPPVCPPSNLKHLCAEILESDTVCITFGAGLSGEYIPTLIEVFESLGLKKLPTHDTALEESLVSFAKRLVVGKEKVLEIVRREWGKIDECDIKETPAHIALKMIVDFCKAKDKEVFVFTDNIDRIHHRVGISLSEVRVPEKKIDMIIYPPIDIISKKKITVLICGQSCDFHCVLSTINSRKHHASQASFFSLNKEPYAISILDGADVDVFNQMRAVGQKIPDYKVISLPALLHIPGNLHATLPALYQELLLNSN